MSPSSNTILSDRAAPRQPLYRALMEAVRERIRAGTIPPGTRAPSESDLIAEFRVSSTTARRCLDELERDNLVRRVQGKGTFVVGPTALTRCRQVGVLYNELFSLSELFLARLLRGIGRVLENTDFEAMLLAMGQIRRSENPAAAVRELVQRHELEGLLILSPLPLPWLGEVLDDGVPMASMNFGYDDPRILSAVVDSDAATRRLCDRLLHAGHRNVIALRRTFPQPVIEGVRLTKPSFESGLGLNIQLETFPYFEEDRTPEVVRMCLKAHPRPTAFVTFGYELVLEVRHALKALNLSVPQDLSLLFYGGATPGPSEIGGELAPVEAMGGWAAEALLQTIDGKAPAERVKTFQTTPQEGASLAPIKNDKHVS